MSSGSFKPKPGSFRGDVHELLRTAEAGQKADILTYFSGHLGPHKLNRKGQPHVDTKQSIWRTSQRLEQAQNPQRRTTGQNPESGASALGRARAAGSSAHVDGRRDLSLPKIVQRASNSVPVQLNPLYQKSSSSKPEGRRVFDSSVSDQKGLNNEEQRKTKQWFGREFEAEQKFRAGRNVAEKHKRKLEKGLKELSAQSWPSRDRLAVFSDVFDDVCELSPVFGRILREIKTEYDLYVNHLMASQSPPPDTLLKNALPSLGKVKEMELEEAEKEVCRLELEARRALQENQQVKDELENLPGFADSADTDIEMLQDTHASRVQTLRLQVLTTWKEVQELEEEMKGKLASADIIAATEKNIRDLKTETLRLIASNDRLKSTNQALENKINAVLNREKSSEATKRAVWTEIRSDLETEGEEVSAVLVPGDE